MELLFLNEFICKYVLNISIQISSTIHVDRFDLQKQKLWGNLSIFKKFKSFLTSEFETHCLRDLNWI